MPTRNFLGQFADPKIPNLLYIHNQFARGYQLGRFSDADFVAYERIDKRENTGMIRRRRRDAALC